jgi:hypothetical protein
MIERLIQALRESARPFASLKIGKSRRRGIRFP